MKYIFYRVIALAICLTLFPAFIFIYLIFKLVSKNSFFFVQKRAGKDKKIFNMYKIRTMINHAEKMQKQLISHNEADGPVFKIYNDPRYTKIGRFLAHTGLDELPQLINIIKGEMSFVGPRPLPVKEANSVPNKFKDRFIVLPGITSPWIVYGAHALSFNRWMNLDLEYIKKQSLTYDIQIIHKTLITILNLLKNNIVK